MARIAIWLERFVTLPEVKISQYEAAFVQIKNNKMYKSFVDVADVDKLYIVCQNVVWYNDINRSGHKY